MSGGELLLASEAYTAAETAAAVDSLASSIEMSSMFSNLLPSMAQLDTAGRFLSAGSLLMGGIAQGNAADYNAEAGKSAALAEEDAAARNAFAQERANSLEAEQLADQQQRAKSKRAVAWGASGVSMAGTPIQVESGASYLDALTLEQTKQTGALAVENIYYGGSVRASKLRQQSALDTYMGKSYVTGGALAAGGSLLSRGASIYGR